jgi:uncharacterized protein YbjT (DUF2867 family)
MVVVAIAGGASGIGLNIANAILNTNHSVVILSRSEQAELTNHGVDVRIVDYNSVQRLKGALHDVHTVITYISTYDSGSLSGQLALLEAAKQSGASRFVASDWGVDCYDAIDAYSHKEVMWQAVKASGLGYTRFVTGLWMNVWGAGAVRAQEAALAGYNGPPFAIDLRAGTATLPGDGSQRLCSQKCKTWSDS